ncbi:uncharacterized protein FFB14_08654 [Fusarium fujikuroi]|nr:uncharacterized protein FFB14_08654 [Fusarium fujikuroi]
MAPSNCHNTIFAGCIYGIWNLGASAQANQNTTTTMVYLPIPPAVQNWLEQWKQAEAGSRTRAAGPPKLRQYEPLQGSKRDYLGAENQGPMSALFTGETLTGDVR